MQCIQLKSPIKYYSDFRKYKTLNRKYAINN